MAVGKLSVVHKIKRSRIIYFIHNESQSDSIHGVYREFKAKPIHDDSQFSGGDRSGKECPCMQVGCSSVIYDVKKSYNIFYP